MKKIGLVVCYHIKNYGSVLQSYATEKIVEKEGLHYECINYKKKKTFLFLLKNLLRCFNLTLLKTKLLIIKKRLYVKFFNKNLESKFKNRNKIFDNFVEQNFKLSLPYYGYSELKKGMVHYDGILLGSDQVWNPMNLGSNYYTLNFAPENMPKITYAASFGVSKIPKYQIKKTKEYLKRIQFISVREQAGQKIIKELISRDVPVVLDPTLMLTIEEWKSIYDKNRLVKEKYIVCYFLGNNAIHREWANKVKEKTGYKIVVLPHMDQIVKIDFKFGDIQYFEAGPKEFLNLIENAEMICTDSFHGTVFSILNNKKFLVFNRYMSTKKGSTNSRISSLLNLLKLENRLYSGNGEIYEIMEKAIDYDEVKKQLEILRKESKRYLDNAIKNSFQDVEG